jgi:hypothetical protein
MFDFIKTNIKNIEPKELIDNSLLNFNITVDSESVIKNRIAEYCNLKFKIIDEKYININGSVHKYFNSGIHNHNDFAISNFVEVCKDLSQKFDLNPYLAYLHNLEFGVNVLLPFDTNKVLNSIISYKGKDCEIESYNGKGFLIRFSFDHYELKIYNKGFQYQLNENILRFEIKVRRMEYFKTRNITINRLSDLLKIEIIEKLKLCLLKAFKEVLMYDYSIKLKGLPQREKNVLMNGRNPKYWIELKQQGKEIKKKRARFNELVLKYGKVNLKETIYNLILEKLKELTKLDTSTEKNVNEYLSQFNTKTLPEITTFISAKPNTEFTQNNYSNIGLIEGVYKRICITCKRDISNQRKGSVFCSEKLYGKEAKKCRNEQSNPKNNYERKEERIYNGVLLFDINEYKQQRAN